MKVSIVMDARLDRIKRRFCGLLTAFTLAVSLLAAAPGRAQVYEVPDVMPDFDQFRQFLPEGGDPPFHIAGYAYCTPTAIMNLIHYMDAHGYPTMANYNYSAYLLTTLHIAALGQTLGTHPEDGTMLNTLDQRLADYLNPYGEFVVKSRYLSGWGESIKISDYYGWLRMTNTVLLSQGYYDQPDKSFHVRNGGHSITLAIADKNQYRIGVQDPAIDECWWDNMTWDIYEQSPNLTNEWWLAHSSPNQDFGGVIGTLDIVPDYLQEYWEDPTFDTYITCVDGYTVIAPKTLITILDSLTRAIKYWNPYHLQKSESPAEASYELPQGQIADLDFHLTLPQVAVLARETGNISLFDLAEQTWKPLATVPGARQLVYGGRQENLYILGKEEIIRISRQGTAAVIARPKAMIDAIGFDELRQRLVCVSSVAKQILFYDAEGVLRGGTLLPAVQGTGKLTLSIQPRDGSLWLHRDGSPQIVQMVADGAGGYRARTLSLVDARKPLGLYVDENSRVFVSEDGLVREYDQLGKRSSRTRFAGLPAGRVLKMTRTYNNFDPAKMSGPGWQNR